MTSEFQKFSLSKNKRTPSPLRKTTKESKGVQVGSSDTILNVGMSQGPCSRACHRISTYSFTNNFRIKRRRMSLGIKNCDNKLSSITHSSQLTFLDFVDLFRAFSLRCRRDLRELYDQLALSVKPGHLKDPEVPTRPNSFVPPHANTCVLTRNNPIDFCKDNDQRRMICDALANASIVSNCSGVDTSQSRCLRLKEFREFLEDHQEEHLHDEDIVELIQRHEPDSVLREACCLSFEGFARYLMDKDNYAYIHEKTRHNDEVGCTVLTALHDITCQ